MVLLSLLLAASCIYAQSSDQMFPTPIRTAEIASSIKARAIGDPRVTTYYYTFEGEQGDVFINVQSKNFTGDIDVYAVPSQQPLTKIVIYGDQPEAETGRVVYLRKPERLLLRIQGRTPGDDDASVRIKFAGSFSASKLDDADSPAVPKVDSREDSDVKVNSVGTLLEVRPKVTPTPDAQRLAEAPVRHEPRDSVEKRNDGAGREEPKVEADEAKIRAIMTKPIVEEKKEDRSTPATTPRNRNRRRAAATGSKTVNPPPPTPSDESGETTVASSTKTSRNRRSTQAKVESPKVDPMAGINLVIYFKDGSRIDRPMTEVSRFAVERAILTVISRNGTIGRYNMTEVSRVSIE
ncbi:MAG: hypothetical protein ABIR33_06215 [Pyrinomonadaceae bacterium]